MPGTTRPTVMLVHGMYMNSTSWDPWLSVAEQHGYDTVVPSWPMHEGPPATLRANIDPGLGKLTFGEVVDHLKAVIDTLQEPPMLIGHSIGGLAVQKLLGDGYGTAAVAISSAPPQGVLTASPVFLRANGPHINPLAGDNPVIMTKERFHYTFCNTMNRDESDAAFELYVVPESRNVPRSTLTHQGRIDFARSRGPLLMLAGDRDHLTPAGLILSNARRYKQPVEVREFTQRSHFICNQPGWEEIAASAFEWLDAV